MPKTLTYKPRLAVPSRHPPKSPTGSPLPSASLLSRPPELAGRDVVRCTTKLYGGGGGDQPGQLAVGIARLGHRQPPLPVAPRCWGSALHRGDEQIGSQALLAGSSRARTTGAGPQRPK